ncbi:glycosyl hydrolase family 3 N terminal domain-containing protein [Apiosordaria backusii]|uniref:beta-glucosidase n=1 Tax=Apiosordaria backusii TaxID=314023 RepID=A0AA40E260_9PEZI|nr:glycosyl hydrolase family 3 N terminal domain-containing protein [Apiosordaria backusii]
MRPISPTLVGLLLSLTPSLSTARTETPFLGFPSPWISPTPTPSDSDPEWQAAYDKAVEFVSNLTLTEKVNLTTGTGWEADRCIGKTGSVPRLGFEGFCLMDGPLGVRYVDKASAFPAGMNAAATFSRKLIKARGEAMGEEFRGKGVDVQLGPVAGALGRTPLGGRNWEGFSPDPYLTGAAIAETIKGIQSKGVIACAKHYILNEQEHYRGSVDVRVDDRTMHEVYLWPFADAVRAGVGAVMCSYNRVNGTYACENEWVQNYLLKGELGFRGFVLSDWGAQHSTLGSALGGLDMAMPGDIMGPGAQPAYGSHWGGALTQAVLKGEVPQWRLDDMVTRIMTAYYRVHTGEYTSRPLPNFSAWTQNTTGPLYKASNSTWTTINEHVDVQSDHAKLIREIGTKSTVLLKNNGILPLKSPKSIAVIGNDAQDPPGGPNACPERACITGTVAMGYGSGTADFPYLISPATALLLRSQKDNITFFNTTSNWDLSTAQSVAASVEIPIVFATATSGENFVSIDGNAGDRNNLTLWDNGDALISAVASVNPNTIVVLHTSGPVVIDYAHNNPNISAIVWAGFPGQESGNSLVDVLFGDVYPQGRTPFTWGKSIQDYGVELLTAAPDPRNPRQEFPEGVFIDYRWFLTPGKGDRNNVTYGFGHGLGYTTFEYSSLIISKHDNWGEYSPTTGTTPPAPVLGSIPNQDDAKSYSFPEGFERWRIPRYVYPWVNLTIFNSENGTAKAPSIGDFPSEARDGRAQELLPAGSKEGKEGGNEGLYEVLYTVTVDVKNIGEVEGVEVVQLYLSLGGPSNPSIVLRGFEDVSISPNESKTVTFTLTRRDLSNWNTETQNWEISKDEKVVFVGSSSVDLRVNGTLPSGETVD